MELKINNGELIEQRTIDVASIAAGSSNQSDIVVNGARGGMVFLIAIALSEVNSGLLWQTVSVCETDGAVPVRFLNATASPIDPGPMQISFIAV